MKNLIIVLGLMLLGAVIFQMMVGDGPDSLKSTVAMVMRHQISQYAGQEVGTL
ncbi:MAG: hypothetical protein PUE84_04725 [Firmicutes bacterium]|nr:hypothetical protein [Bacillota bacterium]